MGFRHGLGRAVVATILVAVVAGARSPTGTGAASPDDEPDLELRPDVLVFDGLTPGEEADDDVTIANVGETSVELDDVEVDGEGFDVLFDNCGGELLEPDDVCHVTIVFRATEAGTFEGTVVLTGPVVLESELEAIVLPPIPTSSVETTIGPPDTEPPDTEPPDTEPPDTEPPATTVIPPTTNVVPETTFTDGPSTSVPTGEVTAEQLARCEADAQDADVQFTPRLDMVVGEITDVDVSAALSTEDLPPVTGTGPPVTIVPTPLRCQVRATLRGQDFDIDPAVPQDGSFLDQPVISWTWQVTPQEAGSHTLQLQLLPVARVAGLEVPGTPVLFEADIAVEAEARSFWQRADDVTRGIAGHPVVTSFAALATIAVALAAGWRWVLRRPWPWARPRPPTPPGGGAGPLPPPTP